MGQNNKQMMVVDEGNWLTMMVRIQLYNNLLSYLMLNHYQDRLYLSTLYSMEKVVNQRKRVYEE